MSDDDTVVLLTQERHRSSLLETELVANQELVKVLNAQVKNLQEKNKKLEERLIGARTLYKSTVKALNSALDDAHHWRYKDEEGKDDA